MDENTKNATYRMNKIEDSIEENKTYYDEKQTALLKTINTKHDTLTTTQTNSDTKLDFLIKMTLLANPELAASFAQTNNPPNPSMHMGDNNMQIQEDH